MTENKNIAAATLISYMTFAISLIIGFLYTPIILKILGEEDYGIRSFSLSLTSYLSLLSLGLGSAYFRFRKLQSNKEGQSGEARINGLFLITFGGLGLIALLAGLVIAYLIHSGLIQTGNIDSSKKTLVSLVVLISSLNIAFSFPLSIIPAATKYKRAFIFENSLVLLDTVLLPIATIIFLRLFYGSYNIVLMTVIALVESLVIKIIGFTFLKVKLKDHFSFKLRRADFKLIKPIFLFSFFSFLVTMSTTIHNSSDQTIVGIMIGATAVTQYSISVQLSTYTNTLSTSITSLFTPRIVSESIDGNQKDVQTLYRTVLQIISLILMCVFGCFISCGKDFIIAWVGLQNANVYEYGVALMLCTVLSVAPKWTYTYHQALNKHQFAAILYILSVLINIGVSIILCLFFGIWGCIIGTVFVSLIEGVGMTIYSKKKFGLTIRNYYYSLLIDGFVAFTSFLLCNGIQKIFYNLLLLSHGVRALIIGLCFITFYLLLEFIIHKELIIKTIKTFRGKGNGI